MDEVPSRGRMILHRPQGVFVYALELAEIYVTRFRDVVELNFLVQAAEDPVELPAGIEHDQVAPGAWVKVLLPQFARKDLVGSQFVVAEGWDSEHSRFAANVRYHDHEAAWDNVVLVLEEEGKAFHVRWSALTSDVDNYGGNPPPTRLDVDGWFSMGDAVIIDETLSDYHANPHGGLWLGLLGGGTLGAVFALVTGWLPVWAAALLGGLAGLACADRMRQRRLRKRLR